MRQLQILLFFIALQNILPAQNAIRGIVLDEVDRQPLPGTTIFIPDLKRGTVSDTAGIFSLDDLPRGTFLVEVSMLGFAKKVLKINSLPAGTNLPTVEILLSHSGLELQEVVVTGVSASTERLKNPAPTTSVKKEILLKNASTNLVDGLAKLPGVSQISTGAGISKPVIRGLGYNRVVILRNGIRQEGQQWGDEHGVELDENEIDRVEIIKGPGSVLYGSDAMAGVVNFLLPHPVTEGSLVGEAQVEFQTNTNLSAASLMQAGNLGGRGQGDRKGRPYVHWMGRASGKKAGNFSNPTDGKVLNSGFKELAASGFVGVSKNWGHSDLHFSTFHQQIGIPEGERDEQGNFIALVAEGDSVVEKSFANDELTGYQNSLGIPRQRVAHDRLVWSNVLFFNENKLTADLGWQQNRRREFGDVLAPGETELHFRLRTWNADLKYFLPERNDWKFSTGISSQRQTNRNFGQEYLIPAYDMHDFGAFVFAQKERDKWFFSGGVRYDGRQVNSEPLFLDENEEPVKPGTPGAEEKFAGFERQFSNVSGSIGASWQVAKPLVAKLNLARGYRAPNLSELSSNGKHEGTFRYEIGNRNLKPETSLQADAGLTFNADHVTIEASGFFNQINRFIFLEKLRSASGGDSIPDPEDGSPAFGFTQGDAQLFGGEIAFDIHPHPLDWLHFEHSFSFVRGIRIGSPAAGGVGGDSLRNLPFMPAPKLVSEIRAQREKPWHSLANLYAKLEGEWFFKQNHAFTAFSTETPTPGYFLLNAGFGGELLNREKVVVCRLFFSADNLLNKLYVNHLSRLKYAPENLATGERGIFNPGRNFSLKVIFPMRF